MKTRLIYGVVAILIFILPSCSPKIQTARWQNKKFTADGKPDEWNETFTYYDSNHKLSFDISNDREKVYIILKTIDQSLQAKIMKNGVTISLQPKIKKQSAAQLKYPLSTNSPMPPSDMNGSPGNMNDPSKRPDPKEMRKQLLKDQKYVQLISGFRRNGKTELSENGITASIDWDTDEFMYYEIAIPFSFFYHREQLVAEDSTVAWIIKFDIEGIELPQFSQGGPPGNGGFPGGAPPGGGNNGFPGGGPSGGGGGFPSGPPPGMEDTQAIARAVKIAVKLHFTAGR